MSSILPGGTRRIFASGLRNPVGLAWEPATNALWTVVNERDGLGDETPPDYLTSVQDGGFYGWPYCYWGRTVDDRVPQDPALVATARTPGLRARRPYRLARARLGARGYAPRLPGRDGDRAARLWNRSTLSGYKVIFVPFAERAPGRGAA